MEKVELLSHEEVADSIDRKLIPAQLARVAKNSGFYIEKFSRAGLEPAGAAKADLRSLPFTEKSELLAEQEHNPPFGRLAARAVTRIHVTSGSTGKPLYIPMSRRDCMETAEAGRRAFECAGLGPGDTVIHCLNYCMWAGGLTDHMSLEATGAAVIPFGTGNTEKLVETILAVKPSAISCTPSYMSRLEVVLRDGFGMAPRSLGLKTGLFGGEGGLQNPQVRGRIEDTWGMKAVDANYGMADVLSIFGAECAERGGLHFHGQGIIHLELIDPATGGEIPVAGGAEGEMVLTHLGREAMPLVRMRTRDIIRINSIGRCGCGRGSFRFEVLGRSDDMIVVRGVNVFPGAVASFLAANGGMFSGEFEFVLETPPPIERPLLRVELSRGWEGAGLAAGAVDRYCRERLNFTPRIETVAFGGFGRTEGKTKRVRRAYSN